MPNAASALRTPRRSHGQAQQGERQVGEAKRRRKREIHETEIGEQGKSKFSKETRLVAPLQPTNTITLFSTYLLGICECLWWVCSKLLRYAHHFLQQCGVVRATGENVVDEPVLLGFLCTEFASCVCVGEKGVGETRKRKGRVAEGRRRRQT